MPTDDLLGLRPTGSRTGATRCPPSVAVIGGGLSGMAAAVALADAGLRVELFEATGALGGRAGSYFNHDAGHWVDLCQHVAMGCCTNLADFCRRTGVEDCFRRQRRLHFIAPDGRRHRLSATPLVPAPLHLIIGLGRLGYLTWRDRLRIGRTLRRLARCRFVDADRQSIGDWLRREGESSAAIERFWSLVLVSALGETLDRASPAAAQKVFVDGFLGARAAYEMVLPQAPLRDIFDRRGGDALARRGIVVHRATKVRRLDGNAERVQAIFLRDGSRRSFDFVVVAVPWRSVRSLLTEPLRDALPGLAGIDAIEAAPITAVHLWLDDAAIGAAQKGTVPFSLRQKLGQSPVTPLPNAALVSRTSQWIFRPPWLAESGYLQVVISASHALAGRQEDAVVADVWSELKATWPSARAATLQRARVVTSRQAVFSVRPGDRAVASGPGDSGGEPDALRRLDGDRLARHARKRRP